MARTRKSMRVESVYKEFIEAASKGKQDKPFKCRHCSSRFTLPSSRSRHEKTAHSHQGKSFKCTMCTVVAALDASEVVIHVDDPTSTEFRRPSA